MTRFLFPDNTVLCNFGAVNRLDLLESLLEGLGRWTDAVANESSMSARFVPALGDLANGHLLGEPIEITDPDDILQIERARRAVFGGTLHQPLRHLGEAQTCHVILTWHEYAGSWWISDDLESLRYASRNGITTRTTGNLIEAAVNKTLISKNEGFALLHQMVNNGRPPRLLRAAGRLDT
ncbi:putative nucleic acid-binding protein [Catenulispora sp. GP43]|uniref:hypothetical protein n=1 Tax=Catenulispora sp. GP43 TaxID=3156263 RepID=UPI0035164D3C